MVKCLIGSERHALVDACKSTGRPFGLVDFSLPSIGLQPNDAGLVINRQSPLRYENAPNPSNIEVFGVTDLSLGSMTAVLAQAGELPTDPQTQRLLGPLGEVLSRGWHKLDSIVPDRNIRDQIYSMLAISLSLNANMQQGHGGVADGSQQVESYKNALVLAASGDPQLAAQGRQVEQDMRQANERSFMSFDRGLIVRTWYDRNAATMYGTPGEGTQEARGVAMFHTLPRRVISLALRKPINGIDARSAMAKSLSRNDIKGDDPNFVISPSGMDVEDLQKIVSVVRQAMIDNPS